MKQGQSSISLLINSPWCQGSCKSDLFQIPSRGFSLLSQCLRYAFETWLGKISNALGQINQRTTTTETECPRACDLRQEKHRIENPVHCHYKEAQLAVNRKVLSSNDNLVQPIFFFFFNMGKLTITQELWGTLISHSHLWIDQLNRKLTRKHKL